MSKGKYILRKHFMASLWPSLQAPSTGCMLHSRGASVRKPNMLLGKVQRGYISCWNYRYSMGKGFSAMQWSYYGDIITSAFICLTYFMTNQSFYITTDDHFPQHSKLFYVFLIGSPYFTTVWKSYFQRPEALLFLLENGRQLCNAYKCDLK